MNFIHLIWCSGSQIALHHHMIILESNQIVTAKNQYQGYHCLRQKPISRTTQNPKLWSLIVKQHLLVRSASIKSTVNLQHGIICSWETAFSVLKLRSTAKNEWHTQYKIHLDHSCMLSFRHHMDKLNSCRAVRKQLTAPWRLVWKTVTVRMSSFFFYMTVIISHGLRCLKYYFFWQSFWVCCTMLDTSVFNLKAIPFTHSRSTTKCGRITFYHLFKEALMEMQFISKDFRSFQKEGKTNTWVTISFDQLDH